MDYTDKLESFTLSLKKANKADSTIKTYKSLTSRFLKYLEEQNNDTSNYTESDVLRYLENQYANGLSKASLEKIVPAINAYSVFLNISTDIKLGNIEFLNELEDKPSQVVVLSKDAQERMYKYANRVWKKRNICMILLFLETGIKLSELVSLNKRDLLKINNIPYLKIDSKIKRTLPVSNALYDNIEQTFNIRFDQNEALFVSRSGTRISPRSVENVTQAFNLTSQILRDTYIYNLMNKDTDTYIITQLAGIRFTDGLIEKYFKNEFVILDEFVELQN